MIYSIWVMKMKATYKITAAEAQELRGALRTVKNAAVCRRMEAVALLGEGQTSDEVAEIKKNHPKYVRTLGLAFHRKGIEAFSVDGRCGGNHQLILIPV